MTKIEQISDEIMSHAVEMLNDAPYVPITDPFKEETVKGKAFIAELKDLRAAFDKIVSVAGAIDSIIKIVSKFV